jgi:hypothetical protein
LKSRLIPALSTTACRPAGIPTTNCEGKIMFNFGKPLAEFSIEWEKSLHELKAAETEALEILKKRKSIETIFAGASRPVITVQGQNCRVTFR